MGTRNLTAVVLNGEYKIAQYGQWDGYPSGQGATALKFCRKYLKTDAGRAKFIKALERVKFVSPEEQEKLWADLGIASKDGWVTTEQVKDFDEVYPYFSRDNGAGILEMVAKSKKKDTLLLSDQSAFAADSVFCEFGYVVDLDKRTLEVYRGFNKEPLPAGQRFSDLPLMEKPPRASTQYYPIKFVAAWKLDELPVQAGFVEAVNKILQPKAEYE